MLEIGDMVSINEEQLRNATSNCFGCAKHNQYQIVDIDHGLARIISSINPNKFFHPVWIPVNHLELKHNCGFDMYLIDEVENSELPEELKQKIIGELERLAGLDTRKPVAWRLWDEDPVNDKPKWVYYDATNFKPGINPADYFFGLEELFKNE